MGRIHFCSQTRNAIYLFILVATGTCSIMFSLCKANFACQVYSQQFAQACSDTLQGHLISNCVKYQCPNLISQYSRWFHCSTLVLSRLSAWISVHWKSCVSFLVRSQGRTMSENEEEILHPDDRTNLRLIRNLFSGLFSAACESVRLLALTSPFTRSAGVTLLLTLQHPSFKLFVRIAKCLFLVCICESLHPG